MTFFQKWPFLQLFFLGNIEQENVFYDILERKNAFQGYKNKKFKKSKNWHFPKGANPWFWSKEGPLFQLFFFTYYRPGKRILGYFWAKKRLFRPKKQEVQRVEKLHFPKRLTHGFGQKIAIFPFFLRIIYQENMCYVILECFNAFLGYKNKNFKKSKNWHFSKNGHFSNFFFYVL